MSWTGEQEARINAAPLTPRERQIVRLLIHGDSNKMIAARLEISERCVKWHLTNTYRKLAVDCRAAAVTAALRRGDLL